MVPIIASHRRRLLQFLIVPLLPHLHEFFFQFPEQNLYWNIAPLRSARIFLSNESLFAQNWFWTRELCLFYPSAAICFEFQNAQRPKFLPYLLVRVFKFIDLECVGMGIWWSFWISTFCFLYMFSNWWKQLRPSRGSTMLTILIEILSVLNSWECFFMRAKHFKHTLPPGWWSGVETNAKKPTIPKISICGKVSLAKLVSVRVC